ncbi:hypothetical protein ACP275_04G171600 [Erythranthe tilingii]
MAAYAAVVSLMNVIYNIQNHPQFSISLFDEKQAESLGEKLDFLLDFIESNHSHELLESEIASAAYAAEDVIESHIVDQIHSGSISSLDLQKLIKVMDHVKDKVVNFKEEIGGLSKVHRQYSMSATSSTPPITGGGKSTKMVGSEEELIQLLDALTGRQSSLQIIPIVGMGGIGKTTLARNAYESRLIVNHFDICAWATISQEYSLKEIFSKLLSPENGQSANEQQLSQKLYQSLIGRRYLIILDDIWSIDAWEKMMIFFPDNNNGSRIILTTRLSNVAGHFGSSYFSKKFLNEDQSWKLFCEKAFLHEEVCPPELEKIGKKVAKKCKGLPLLIVVIGGLLKSKTQELWENIANNINSILTSEEDTQRLDILSLSYSHLPAHLKACFLYMGIFHEDSEILVSVMIKLWIAEGFIKPNKTQSLEDVAECYLKELVDRNLLLVGGLKLNGKIKTCTIHDLLRDLCIKTAQKENFFYLIRFCDSLSGINKACRRILCHENFAEVNCDPLPSHTLKSEPLTRSLLSYEDRPPLNFRLLRVLNVVRSDNVSDPSLSDILKQVNLRYLPGLWYKSHQLPFSISLLWNLQTLKIAGFGGVFAPPEIWAMPQLRHLEFSTWIYLPDPSLRREEKDDVIVLKNLHTLKRVLNLKLTDEVCKRIPNVKKLKIMYFGLSKSSRYNHLYNIGRLHKLESLRVYFCGDFSVFQVLKQILKYIVCSPLRPRGNLLKNLKFPTSLKKLTLSGSNLDWEELKGIGSLPNLEVLKLEYHSVRGSKWNPIEGQFLRLKYLRIAHSRLKYWNAESFHFPALENLVLQKLHKLAEIPSGIGEIPTLGLIHLYDCSESAAISAMGILEEQQSQGNEDLRVRIIFWHEYQLEWFMEKVDSLECFNSNNLQVSHLD